MKITVKTNKARAEREYPYLVTFENPGKMVVLFTGPNCGIRLTPGNPPFKVGEYMTAWAENEFKPCPKGTVATIEQE